MSCSATPEIMGKDSRGKVMQQMDVIRFSSKGYSVEKTDPEKIERIERKVERTRRREKRAREERRRARTGGF